MTGEDTRPGCRVGVIGWLSWASLGRHRSVEVKKLSKSQSLFLPIQNGGNYLSFSKDMTFQYEM